MRFEVGEVAIARSCRGRGEAECLILSLPRGEKWRNPKTGRRVPGDAYLIEVPDIPGPEGSHHFIADEWQLRKRRPPIPESVAEIFVRAPRKEKQPA